MLVKTLRAGIRGGREIPATVGDGDRGMQIFTGRAVVNIQASRIPKPGCPNELIPQSSETEQRAQSVFDLRAEWSKARMQPDPDMFWTGQLTPETKALGAASEDATAMPAS